MIQIKEREVIKEKLSQLTMEHKPLFGKMGPQHMVEHLSLIMRASNGKFKAPLFTPEEKIERRKQFLYTDDELQPGFRGPGLPDEPMPLRFQDLDEAQARLMKELDDFDAYYAGQPALREVHPVFGPLNYDEWTRFHNKHFQHHFKQFGLV